MEDSTILTREEIGEAIVFWIGMHKGATFFPYYITGTDVKLHIPEKVQFKLGYIPKGSSSGDCPNNI